ncbi:MAG: hypothetical protein A2Y25_09085 [Candidatus Melainabacteria bacterium GWF2_37_15]|nr:MAG: hypothetical protein A2Y25_09085 [Candidatus Melainabacteria bacterium GWF2_37_15]
MTGKLIHNQKFTDFLQSNCNLMKITINGFEEIIQYLYEDIQKLQGVPLKPDRKAALALLGYLSLNDQNAREIVEALCGYELQKYIEWLESYCVEQNCTMEQALKRITE